MSSLVFLSSKLSSLVTALTAKPMIGEVAANRNVDRGLPKSLMILSFHGQTSGLDHGEIFTSAVIPLSTSIASLFDNLLHCNTRALRASHSFEDPIFIS